MRGLSLDDHERKGKRGKVGEKNEGERIRRKVEDGTAVVYLVGVKEG